MNPNLRDDLHRSAEDGRWWQPSGKPSVDAGWIRELLVSGKIPGSGAPVHARGILIRGVVLNGKLDLEGARLAVPIAFDRIESPSRIVLDSAVGIGIAITESRIVGLDAQFLTLEGSLILSGTKVGVVGFRPNGSEESPNIEVALRAVSAAGTGHAIDLDRAEIRRNVYLDNGFRADGEVSLGGASIGGQLLCNRGKFVNERGIALRADSVRVTHGVYLSDGFSAIGEVSLAGASIEQLTCSGGRFTNKGGYALMADDLRVAASVYLDDGFEALGEVRLAGAKIGGQLSCRAGCFLNGSGFALFAEYMSVEQMVFLDFGFTAHGEVRFNGASVGGLMRCTHGTFSNEGGRALVADDLRLTFDLYLDSGFSAAGEVHLMNASIGGDLVCRGGRFSAPNATGFSLQRSSVTGGFVWHPEELAPTTGIDMTAASVGWLDDDIEKWPEKGRLQLVRFSYSAFESDLDVRRRIEWVQLSTPFHGQPYEQLASVYRAAGNAVAARDVGIAKEKTRNRTLPMSQRGWHKAWGVLSSYGYRPAQSLMIFTAVLFLAFVFYWWAGESGVMEPTNPPESEAVIATECTMVYPCYQSFIYAADVMVPIVDLNQRDLWRPDAARHGSPEKLWPWSQGETVRIVETALIIIGWVLTVAFIASVGQTISRRETAGEHISR